MSKDKLYHSDPVGPLMVAAVSIYQSDEEVAELAARIANDTHVLEDWASSEDPELSLCAGLALAVLSRDVSKASEKHLNACMERLRKAWKDSPLPRDADYERREKK